MAPTRLQPSRSAVWRIAARQHDRITYRQLIELGMTPDGIRHRVRSGRLHRVARGIYAISRPRGTLKERWMTDALRCGDGAGVSHGAAFALWGLGKERFRLTEVSVPLPRCPTPRGVLVHRRASVLPAELRHADLIPVTSPALTLIDNARALGSRGLEAAVNDADGRGLTDPDAVSALAARFPMLPGSKLVRDVLDRFSFRLTDSELEREFLRLVIEAGLPLPDTQIRTNAGRVDFCWTELGLIVEADSLRHHRTPSQQATDRRRDQEHLAEGLSTLRFTHHQIHFERDHVIKVLRAVFARVAG